MSVTSVNRLVVKSSHTAAYVEAPAPNTIMRLSDLEKDVDPGMENDIGVDRHPQLKGRLTDLAPRDLTQIIQRRGAMCLGTAFVTQPELDFASCSKGLSANGSPARTPNAKGQPST